MQQAVDQAASIAEETGGLGRLGRPMNRRSPFFVGMAAAAGVAVTYGLVELVIRARSVLVLIGLALFIAAGLDPAVGWLTRRRLPRWSAVIVILLVVAAVVAGFAAAADPAAHRPGHRAGARAAALHAYVAGPQLGAGQAERPLPRRAAAEQAAVQQGHRTGRRRARGRRTGAQRGQRDGDRDRAGGLLPGRHAAHQAVPVPARAGLPAAPGHPDRRRDLRQGRRLHAGELRHLADRRAGHLGLAGDLRRALPGAARPAGGAARPDPDDRARPLAGRSSRWSR